MMKSNEEEESKKKRELCLGKEVRGVGIVCFCSSAVLVLCVTIKQKKELKI
jgi:hypothetical protein